jgi:hypothetical protein
MTKTQRVVIAVYFLGLAYCCLWIPWYVQNPPNHYGGGYHRDGYAWVWVGTSEYARPELSVIALRLVALTAIGGASFLLAGLAKKSETTN